MSELNEEMKRVIESPLFLKSKKHIALLKYLVAMTDKGEQQHITQKGMAIEGLGKKSDFDPAVSPLVRVQMGRLRKRLNDYYENASGNSQRIYIKTGSYIPKLVPVKQVQEENDTTWRKINPADPSTLPDTCRPVLRAWEHGFLGDSKPAQDYAACYLRPGTTDGVMEWVSAMSDEILQPYLHLKPKGRMLQPSHYRYLPQFPNN